MFDTSKISDLNKEIILSKVSEIDIFRRYIPQFAELKKAFRSDLYEDTKPGCTIYLSNGRPRYKDHGNPLEGSYDCFEYLMKKYNCSFHQVLDIINHDFNLKCITPSYTRMDVPLTKSTVKEGVHSTIRIKKRPWTKGDQEYWSKYELPLDFLESKHVKSISNYWIINDLREYHYYVGKRLAYSYDEFAPRRKLYFPYSEMRFFASVKATDWCNFDDLPWVGDHLIITSSNKDCLIWSFCGYNCIAPQGESVKIPEDFIIGLYKRFETLYINYDNDDTGQKMSALWASKYGLKPIFTEGVKDIGEYTEKHGLNASKELMKGLLND